MMRYKCFQDRFLPVPLNGGFRMDGYWIWGASVTKGDDGLYHMFASRWENNLAFSPHWLTNSEIVHAVSSKPEGPYEFQDTALPERGEKYWDGRMTHNPNIHRYKSKYLLFYTGTTYTGKKPAPEKPLQASDPGNPDEHHKVPPQLREAHGNQRIGLAIAESPFGPWKRMDKPILEPRPGKWDSCVTTNPTACISEDGSVTMIYKSAEKLGALMFLGICRAENYSAPFKRLTDTPLFDFSHVDDDLEDPCLWKEDGCFMLLAKSMEGRITGIPRTGVLFRSKDAVNWEQISKGPAYTRKLRWENDKETEQCFLERPQILMENGKASNIFFATATGSDHIGGVKETWNVSIPLK